MLYLYNCIYKNYYKILYINMFREIVILEMHYKAKNFKFNIFYIKD